MIKLAGNHTFDERKKKCEHSQIRLMDWSGKRPFGHQVAHLLLIANTLS